MAEQLMIDWTAAEASPTAGPLRRAFIYRLEPTKAQAEALDAQRRAACRLYNAALQERIEGYRWHGIVRPGPHPNRTSQSAQLIKIAADGNLGVAHTDIASDILARVDKAFRAFFRRVKAGEKPGHPRYQSSKLYPSFAYRRPGPSCRVLDNRRLQVAGVGELKVRWHRPLEGEIKTITFKPNGRQWEVIFSCVVERPMLPPSAEAVGLDVGLASFATLDSGKTIDNPKWLATAAAKIRKAQRRVARRKKGSQRRLKAVLQLRRLHTRIARQRAYFQHTEARKLVNRFGTIITEDLHLKGLARGILAGPVADAAWGGFLQKLDEKAEEGGRRHIGVNPAGTSQQCPCGQPVPKELKDRWHHCPACGLDVPRDHASAIEIKRRGLAH